MDYMNQALSLAKLALGQVSPNPAVGAVIVNNGEIVGQGYTQPPGFDHAEIVALKQAGEKARGGILYVTLEPCCHFGRTPPCTRAIMDAGITEVHYAMADPNPLICGKGVAELASAGIKIVPGESAEDARELNEPYLNFIKTGLPLVTVKFATSLDGRVATRLGSSRWISSEESRMLVHELRYQTDAIMAGISTVLADDPRLTSKCCGGRGGTAMKQPLRVIVDSQARTPPTARIFHEPGNTLLAVAGPLTVEKKAVFNGLNVELLEVPDGNGKVDLQRLLRVLGERQITSIMVESGGVLLGSLFDQKLVDKVIAFVAPIIIGGVDAKRAVDGLGAETMAEVIRLKRIRVERIAEDVMISGYVND